MTTPDRRSPVRRPRRSNSLKDLKRLTETADVTFDPGDEIFRMYEVSKHLSRICFASGFILHDPGADVLQTRYDNTVLPASLRDLALPPAHGAWRANFFRAKRLNLLSHAYEMGVRFHPEGIAGQTEELISGAKAKLVWEDHIVGEYVRVLHWLPHYIEYQPALLHKMIAHTREAEPFFHAVDQWQRIHDVDQKRYRRTVGRAQDEINRQIAAQYPGYADISIATKGIAPLPLRSNFV
jgi:hypothetical protein